MTQGYQEEIESLHLQLSRLYRAGSRDYDKIDGLWARIERLEAFQTMIEVNRP